MAQLDFAHDFKKRRGAADIVRVIGGGFLVRFADIGQRGEMHDGRRTMARQDLAQARAIGKLADLERAPFHRLGIAAREIVVS